jgi:hypothetical protein
MRHESYGRRATDVAVCVGGLTISDVGRDFLCAMRDWIIFASQQLLKANSWMPNGKQSIGKKVSVVNGDQGTLISNPVFYNRI